jgi:hypothetical protein
MPTKLISKCGSKISNGVRPVLAHKIQKIWQNSETLGMFNLLTIITYVTWDQIGTRVDQVDQLVVVMARPSMLKWLELRSQLQLPIHNLAVISSLLKWSLTSIWCTVPTTWAAEVMERQAVDQMMETLACKSQDQVKLVVLTSSWLTMETASRCLCTDASTRTSWTWATPWKSTVWRYRWNAVSPIQSIWLQPSWDHCSVSSPCPSSEFILFYT